MYPMRTIDESDDFLYTHLFGILKKKYSSVTNESFAEKTQFYRTYKMQFLVAIIRLFTTTWSIPLLVEFLFPEDIKAQYSAILTAILN